jgi:hypothetical protein
MEKDERFTEKERSAMRNLPQAEQEVFQRRLSDITMRKLIADSAWEKVIDEITDDTNVLVSDIKARIAVAAEEK